MKIVSWNVWNRSSDLASFARFVEQAQADVFAFQELTEAHVACLRSFAGFELYLAEDFIEDGQLTYLGVFTRLAAGGHRVRTHNSARATSPSLAGRRSRWIECLQSQSLAIETAQASFGIVNLHLTCGASPRRRRRELEAALAGAGDTRPLVVCGDFNSFAKPRLNWAVGWFYGFGPRDLFTDEVGSLTRFAARRGMARLPEKAVTFPRHRLHLDHILVRGLSVVSSGVAASTHGSDHLPVFATLAAQARRGAAPLSAATSTA